MVAPLSAPLEVGFDYTRSLSPVHSRFFTALRDRRVEGVRGADGRVHVPPVEYDPVTGAPLSETVPVSATGTVLTWSWMPDPIEGQPLDRPFAWAMVRLDGADTGLLHAVDTGGDPSGIHTGLRVRIRWAAETAGTIRDIACFEPADTPSTASGTVTRAEHQGEPVTQITTPIHLQIGRASCRERV